MPRFITAVPVVVLLSCASALAQSAKPPPVAPKPPAAPSPMKLAAERTQAALQQHPPGRPEDVKTQEALLAALYDVISGPAGKARDWQRFRSLFYPGAQMASVHRAKPGGLPGVSPITPDDYVAWGETFFKTHGFFEKETHRQVYGYGDLVNVLSAYEAREAPEGAVLTKGVNNIQLVFDGQRWWVLHISWTDEKAAGAPVPATFTRK
ncbi:nuclear transport factor 2 family protein [Myxococcus sp. XM-1-1-1]|uniref:nuclear transport factor 2 family protein n=1 Tax=Myxococcus sp. XM-1-1-1 TaxID=2874602 RepID=UPI001CBE6542|nr:nuclear transport factor 2 family protein [Myxococcus sp. XM-1-1-1]MBZ4411414.1 nuclear transport factor 2 family protein [Myxococcus sp. XM-1-1-1]